MLDQTSDFLTSTLHAFLYFPSHRVDQFLAAGTAYPIPSPPAMGQLPKAAKKNGGGQEIWERFPGKVVIAASFPLPHQATGFQVTFSTRSHSQPQIASKCVLVRCIQGSQ